MVEILISCLAFIEIGMATNKKNTLDKLLTYNAMHYILIDNAWFMDPSTNINALFVWTNKIMFTTL